MRKAVDDKYNKIPPEHNWNINEKGNQMGGGRKGDGTKYIFWIEDKERYCMHSHNLELITTIGRGQRKVHVLPNSWTRGKGLSKEEGC
jgi:hypothetical protein